MKLIVINRIKRDGNSCRGHLVIYDGDIPVLSLQTLENDKRKIPKGQFTLIYNYSPKFNTHLWLIDGVRSRYGIRIHSANKFDELNGCIALGLYGDKDMRILESRRACDILNKVLDTKTIYKLNIIEL